jgi:hypothetical protein
MLFIDQLLQNGFLCDSKEQEAYLLGLLDASIKVSVKNVAHYYYVETPQEIWEFKEFPNIALPWEHTWIEWPAASSMNINGKMHFYPDLKGVYMGILFVSRKFREDWLVSATTFIGRLKTQQKARLAECFIYRVASTGRFCESGINLELQRAISSGFNVPLRTVQGDVKVGKDLGSFIIYRPQYLEALGLELLPVDQVTTVLHVPLLALSFCHCKNVTVQTQRPATKLNKKRIKRGKPPYVEYKTLEITPIKKMCEGSVNASGMPLKRALHICRGHFKDYRKSGLFGKHKDVFWWDMAVRGDRQKGMIVKDYEVKSDGAK